MLLVLPRKKAAQVLFGLYLLSGWLQGIQVNKYKMGGDQDTPPSVWNKLFHTLVPDAGGVLIRCSYFCVRKNSVSLPCNIFIIHEGECYLGDLNGNHTLIQTEAGSGAEANLALFSPSEGADHLRVLSNLF